MHRPAIVLFCGNAARDEQQKQLPPRFLTRLHDALRRRLRALDADVYVATHDHRAFRVGDTAWPIASLGTQIDTALRHCFDRGHQRVVIVAGDAPVDEAIVQRALDATSPVIAASGDGGFALAAFSEAPDIDWNEIVANRAHAAQALRDRMPLEELPRVDDIDTIEDARRLLRDVPSTEYSPSVAPQKLNSPTAQQPSDRAPPQSV